MSISILHSVSLPLILELKQYYKIRPRDALLGVLLASAERGVNEGGGGGGGWRTFFVVIFEAGDG